MVMSEQCEHRQGERVTGHSPDGFERMPSAIPGLLREVASAHQGAPDQETAGAAVRRYEFVDAGVITPHEPMSSFVHPSKEIDVLAAVSKPRVKRRMVVGP